MFYIYQPYTLGFGIETITSPQIMMNIWSSDLPASTIVLPAHTLVRQMTFAAGSVGTFSTCWSLQSKVKSSSHFLLPLGIYKMQWIKSRSESLLWIYISNSALIFWSRVKKTSIVSLISLSFEFKTSPGCKVYHSCGHILMAIIWLSMVLSV